MNYSQYLWIIEPYIRWTWEFPTIRGQPKVVGLFYKSTLKNDRQFIKTTTYLHDSGRWYACSRALKDIRKRLRNLAATSGRSCSIS